MRQLLKPVSIFVVGVASMVLLSGIMVSCDSDEPESATSFSYRDGVYSGSQLKVMVNGAEVTTVNSVTVTSALKDANVSTDKDQNDFNYPSNPTYNSTIKIVGFPKQGKAATFTTISDISGFTGETNINGIEYEYIGEFTGDPLMNHDNQGLILSMNTK
jgi:hypothetical protein